jgi:hypothetical protein
MIKGKLHLSFATAMAAVGALFSPAALAGSNSTKRQAPRRQQPRLQAQVRLQAAQAKRDRRALRNLRIKANGGYRR